jgi:hypothetical protein
LTPSIKTSNVVEADHGFWVATTNSPAGVQVRSMAMAPSAAAGLAGPIPAR